MNSLKLDDKSYLETESIIPIIILAPLNRKNDIDFHNFKKLENVKEEDNKINNKKKLSFTNFLSKYTKSENNIKNDIPQILNKAIELNIKNDTPNKSVINKEFSRNWNLTIKEDQKKNEIVNKRYFNITMKNILRSSILSIIVSITLLNLLFLDDLRILFIKKKYDNVIDILLLSFYSFLIIETILCSIYIKQYRFSVLFWLDIFSLLTLLPEINIFFPVTGDYIIVHNNL